MEPLVYPRKDAQWFHTRDHEGGLNLSKTSLGEFTYEVLKRGCQIGQFWAFAPNYHRSFVKASVYMTPAQKEALEKETRFRFEDPPKVHLNSA